MRTAARTAGTWMPRTTTDPHGERGIHMRNLTMLTDLYQMTMMNGYIQAGIPDRIAVFDLF